MRAALFVVFFQCLWLWALCETAFKHSWNVSVDFSHGSDRHSFTDHPMFDAFMKKHHFAKYMIGSDVKFAMEIFGSETTDKMYEDFSNYRIQNGDAIDARIRKSIIRLSHKTPQWVRKHLHMANRYMPLAQAHFRHWLEDRFQDRQSTVHMECNSNSTLTLSAKFNRLNISMPFQIFSIHPRIISISNKFKRNHENLLSLFEYMLTLFPSTNKR